MQRPDLVALTVLALLNLRPGHAYELQRQIADTHKDYVTGLPRSLYHAVERLARDELIVPVETTREGRRPERTVYEITDEGRRELASRLRRMLSQPDGDRVGLVAAASLIGALPVREAARALRHRTAELESRIAGWTAHMTAMTDNGLPAVLLLKLDYQRALDVAELAWVRDVLGRLDNGSLAWPDDLRQLHLDLTDSNPAEETKAAGEEGAS